VSVRAISSRGDLQTIARCAMVERGFQPDFGADVLTELGAISGPAATRAGDRRRRSETGSILSTGERITTRRAERDPRLR
jgi:hypothetical protein